MLRVHLLAELRLTADGDVIPLPRGRPARALLAWLALHPGRHPRARVAAELWPDVLDESARASLRTALSSLRAALGPHAGALAAERDEVGLDAWVDVLELPAAELAEAGPLLGGLTDDWVLRARDDHRDRVGAALAELARAAASPAEAIVPARARVTLDPLSEEAARDLARQLEAAGDRGAALVVLERLRERLRKELAVAPSAATRELIGRLRDESPPPAVAAGAEPAGRSAAVVPGSLALPPLAQRRADAPLVGRTAELGRVLELYERAAGGDRILGLIAGEPGIGKTRLALEAARAAHAHGATVLVGRCTEEPLAAYQPLVEALRHLVAAPGTIAPAELGRLFPDVLPVPEGAGDRLRLFEAITSLLDAAGPVLLVIDDAHWADAGTLLAVASTLRAPSAAPLLVLATYRDADLDRHGPLTAMLADLTKDTAVQRIQLGGLAEPDVRALMTSTLGDPGAAAALSGRVTEETAGNPFFVGEIARHVRDGGGASAVPEGIRDVLRRRLARLGPDASTTLLHAAVAGREFTLATLESLGEPRGTALLAALDEALRAELIREEPQRPGAFTFAHALVRDALLAEHSSVRVQALHARIADATPSEAPAVLAHHRAAAAGDPQAAAAAALSAARAAMATLAYEEAAAHAARGLDALGAEEPGLLLMLGDALLRAGDGVGSRDAFRRAAAVAADATVLADAALGFGGLAVTVTHPDPLVVGMLARALASGPDDVRRARLLARLAIERYYEPPAGEELSAQALALARRCGDTRALVDALTARHVARWNPAGLEERLALGEELVRVAGAAGDGEATLKGLDWLVTDRLEAADDAGARQAEDDFTALADRLALPAFRWYPAVWAAARATEEGRFDDVAVHLAQARRLGVRTGDSNVERFCGAVEGFSVPILRGRFGDIDLEESARLANASPVPRAWYSSLSWLTAVRGDVDAARSWLAQAVGAGLATLAFDMNWPSALQELSETVAILGDARLGRELYAALLPYADRRVTSMRAVGRLGVVDHSLGRAAGAADDLDAAVLHVGRALQHHRDRGLAPMVVASAMSLAGVHERRGEEPAAAALRAEARALGQSVGVDPETVGVWWWDAGRGAQGPATSRARTRS